MKNIKLMVAFALVATFQSMLSIDADRYNIAAKRVIECLPHLQHLERPSTIEVFKTIKQIEKENIFQKNSYSPFELRIIAIASLQRKYDLCDNHIHYYNESLRMKLHELDIHHTFLSQDAKENESLLSKLFYAKSQEELNTEYCQQNIERWEACKGSSVSTPIDKSYLELCTGLYLPKK